MTCFVTLEEAACDLIQVMSLSDQVAWCVMRQEVLKRKKKVWNKKGNISDSAVSSLIISFNCP